MSNLVKRSITGVIFLIILIGCILWNKYSFSILFGLITAFSLKEFYELIDSKLGQSQKWTGIVIGFAIFACTFLIGQGIIKPKFLALNLLSIFFFFLIELYRNKENPFGNIAYSILGIVFIAIPYSLLALIYSFPENLFDSLPSPMLILGSFIFLWTSDVMAYVFGSLLGKHKLFERISPKKSWEGSIGGGISTLAVAYFAAPYLGILSTSKWVGLAAIVVVFGGLGDLIESMFKRSINIKDSGNILPGHGGLLDRFDGILLASPFIFVYLILIS